MAISDGKYIAVTTFRDGGEAASAPTWVVATSDGRIGFCTALGSGTTTRLRHDPRLRVQPCDARGRPRPGAPEVTGTAEIVRSGRLFDEVRAGIREKYGLLAGIPRIVGRVLGQRGSGLRHADTVVLVRLDD